MNWLVFHIVSGDAFFSGIVLVIVAAVASTRDGAIYKRLTALPLLVGVLLIVLSSTPIPYWYYAIAGLLTLAWVATAFVKRWRRWAAAGVCIVWLGAALLELPYHFSPSLEPAPERSITIVGDSVTAGIGGEDTSETWPHLLTRRHKLEVRDISQMGATADSVLKLAKTHDIDSPIVVVEVGGNDLLGGTSSAQFGRDLDGLLSHLSAADRQIVMIELPLPPFFHEYGRVQRTVADRHGVKLVPKRRFLSVLAGGGATLDTIHLSQDGHREMADCVWSIVGPAYERN